MYILLTTHGQFANGILESYQMIAGEAKHIETIILDDDGLMVYQNKLKKWFGEKTGHDILVLTDLKGGTPYNECLKIALSDADHIRLLTGLNLGMLLEVGLKLDCGYLLNELANLAYDAAKEAITIVEDLEDSNDFYDIEL